MPTLLANKWLFIAVIVGIGCLSLGGLLAYEHYTGGEAAKLAQANAQIKHDVKVRDKDAKIAKGVPVSGDAVDKFLLSHTSK